MVEYFRGRYRIRSTRVPGYDYSAPGLYFITICTKGKEHYLGTIENGIMIFSETGKMVSKYLLEIPDHYPNFELDEHVIMPNHIHFILKVNRSSSKTKRYHLGIIICQFKRICTVTAIKNHLVLNWQPRYYDHIIRNNYVLSQIRQYIRDNPVKWNSV